MPAPHSPVRLKVLLAAAVIVLAPLAADRGIVRLRRLRYRAAPFVFVTCSDLLPETGATEGVSSP